ncbi:MAG TPA: hypothetical protein VE910_04850 [Dongiaceae bacterium]|nr:hypothetical protein [Dongiaceae bacterium]
MNSIKRLLTVLGLEIALVSGGLSVIPPTYCFSGGTLCCDSYSGDDCCSFPTTAESDLTYPDHPVLSHCCNGTLLLSARTVIARPDVRPLGFVLLPLAEPSASMVPALPGLIGSDFAMRTTQIPHLSSVVLRI